MKIVDGREFFEETDTSLCEQVEIPRVPGIEDRIKEAVARALAERQDGPGVDPEDDLIADEDDELGETLSASEVDYHLARLENLARRRERRAAAEAPKEEPAPQEPAIKEPAEEAAS